MPSFRLFPSTSGPGAITPYSGNFVSGMAFTVNKGGCWFEGYWWWLVAGQPTTPVKCALWSVKANGAASGTVVAGSVVTSGTLSIGWNYVPLAAPVPISADDTYIAAVGVNGPFPDTTNWWGVNAPAGLVVGPIVGFSDNSGTLSSGWNFPQGIFTTAGSDPALVMPNTRSGTDNFWVDVQVRDTIPAGYQGSFRLWPNKAAADPYSALDIGVNYVLATEVRLSGPCAINKVWFYSPAGATQLPTEAGVWDINTQGQVASNTSPSWSGAAGSGWISTAVSGTLLPGSYRVAVYNGAATPSPWSFKRLNFWTPGTASAGSGSYSGVAGLTAGPLYAPRTLDASVCSSFNGGAATEPGQSPFASGPPLKFPNQYVGVHSPGGALFQNYWVDLEVTPVPVSGTAAVHLGAVTVAMAGTDIPVAGGMSWPAVADIRLELQLPAGNADVDTVIGWARAAAIDYGVRRLNNVYPANTTSLPPAAFEACLIHACRLYRRRDSIDGTLGFGDAGIVRVGRFDADIESLYTSLGPVVFG